MNNYLERMYNDTKRIIMEKTQMDDNSELLKMFKKYIYGSYNGIIENDKLYDFFLKLEIKQWSRASADEIEAYFIPDIALINLERLSREALDLCLKKIHDNSKITEDVYSTMKGKMNNYFNNVKNKNKIRAQVLLSEGLLDLEYAYKDTNITSMRLGFTLAARKSK